MVITRAYGFRASNNNKMVLIITILKFAISTQLIFEHEIKISGSQYTNSCQFAFLFLLFYVSKSLRQFERCSEMMNDPLYLRFVCLEQDGIFPKNKSRCFLVPYRVSLIT